MGSLDSYTLEELIRQTLVVGFEGITPPPALVDLVARKGLGGIFLFRRNVDSPEQIANLCARFQEAALASPKGLPLFVGIDHEGGRVTRLSEPFTRFPPAAQLGKKKSPDLCREMGRVMARELRVVGINMNCAPVLDVEGDPRNPVLGDRVFGGDAELVSELGIQVIRGLQGDGVIAVGKHFPGHRAITVDPHLDLPTSPLGLEDLAAVDFTPFRRAIAEGVAALMTAHVLYPRIEPERPATLSSRFFDGMLRQDLLFSGLVVTDDLGMGAIARHYSVEIAAVQAIAAGSDILLLCQGWEKLEDVVEALRRAVDEGKITQERLRKITGRILGVKDKFLLPYRGPDLQAIPEVLGCPEHAAVARQAWS